MFDRREIEFRKKDGAQRAKAMRMSLDIDVHLRASPSLGLDRASRAWHIDDMCNLYSMPRNQAAIRNLFEVDGRHREPPIDAWHFRNILPQSCVSVRTAGSSRWLGGAYRRLRRRCPTPPRSEPPSSSNRGKEIDFNELLRKEPDKGTTRSAT